MRALAALLLLLPLTAAATPTVIPPGDPLEATRLHASPGPTDAAPGTEGVVAGPRTGKPFTRKGKAVVKQDNANANEGRTRCEGCGVETVPPQKHEKGVTPPPNEAHVDHKVPRSKGGDGSPENGQVLCRECNLEKSDKAP